MRNGGVLRVPRLGAVSQEGNACRPPADNCPLRARSTPCLLACTHCPLEPPRQEGGSRGAVAAKQTSSSRQLANAQRAAKHRARQKEALAAASARKARRVPGPPNERSAKRAAHGQHTGIIRAVHGQRTGHHGRARRTGRSCRVGPAAGAGRDIRRGGQGRSRARRVRRPGTAYRPPAAGTV